MIIWDIVGGTCTAFMIIGDIIGGTAIVHLFVTETHEYRRCSFYDYRGYYRRYSLYDYRGY